MFSQCVLPERLLPFGEFCLASAQDTVSAFHLARDRHRIAEGSTYDWDGKGARHAWRVGSVRALRKPVPVGSTGMTGFGARSFEVTFASSSSAPREGGALAFDGISAMRPQPAAPEGLSQRPEATPIHNQSFLFFLHDS